MTEAAPGKPVPWRLDLALGLIVTLGPQAVLAANRWSAYYFGRRNAFPPEIEWCVQFCVLALFVFAFVVQTCVKWRRAGWVSRILRLLVIGWVYLGAVTAVFEPRLHFQIWRMPARLFVPDDVSFLHGVKQWVEERADIEAIREWAKANPGWEDRQMLFPALPDYSRQPACIQVLQPSWVRVHSDSKVSIEWGGGFSHWGMVIYPESAKPREPAYNKLRIAPGVILWEDL